MEEKEAITGPLTPPPDSREAKLTIEIKNERPVELVDLTTSFLSLAEEYRRFVAAHPEFDDTVGVKLYVKEIRTGSIVADVIAMAAVGIPMALPYITESNHLIEFGKHLKTTYDYFLGRRQLQQPLSLEKQDLKLLSSFVEPKDQGSQLNLIASEGGNVVVNINITSQEANATQNLIGRYLTELKEPETRLHEKVLLYWYQARPDLERPVGDRAIIESISPAPVKTIFADESIKAAMNLSDPNPFLSAYIVDVFVDTIKARPAVYKILGVHERIDKEAA
jgi:hypothetical protein